MLLTIVAGLVTLTSPPDTGQEVLDRWLARLKTVNTAEVVVDIEGARGKQSQTVKMMRPHFYIVTSDQVTMVQNDDGAVNFMKGQEFYTKFPSVAEGGFRLTPGGVSGFESLINPDYKAPKATGEAVETTFQAKPALEVTLDPGAGNKELVQKLYFSKDSGVPLGSTLKLGQFSSTTHFREVKLDVPLTKELFVFQAPAGVMERKYEQPDYMGKLLKVGEKAPDFTIKTPDGKDLKLSESLKNSKGLLLNFWFYG